LLILGGVTRSRCLLHGGGCGSAVRSQTELPKTRLRLGGALRGWGRLSLERLDRTGGRGRWKVRRNHGRRRFRARRRSGFRRGVLTDAGLGFGHHAVIFVRVFEKIGDVQEGVAVKPDVHESGLHAGQHPAHAAFVNPAHQADVGIPLIENFYQIVFFKHSHLRLVRRRGDKQLLWHG
jgi:hypothetical protein